MEIEMISSESLGKVICEEWRPIAGYEGIYEVSNMGRIKSLDRVISQTNRYGTQTDHVYKGKILKESVGNNGYLHIDLHKDGKTKRVLIHRLVASHFLEKQDGADVINHLDCNKENNSVPNLEWCTQSHNIKYAYEQGTKTPPHMQKVAQYGENGSLIRIWDSIAEASRELGLKASNIGKVCRGQRHQTGGYKWQYIEQRSH